MQPRKDPLVVIFIVIVSLLLVSLLPFLLIFLTGNNSKEVAAAKQKPSSLVDQTAPVSRIQESNQAKAQAAVRQAASIVEGCVTKELGLKKSSGDIYSTGATGCANVGYLTGAGGFARGFPTTILLSVSVAKDAVCIHSLGGITTYWYSTSVGSIQTTPPSGCSEQTS